MADRDQEVTEVTESEYKGSPVLILPSGRFPFSFGVSKAKLVLKYIEEIKQFVAKHAKE